MNLKTLLLFDNVFKFNLLKIKKYYIIYVLGVSGFDT